MAELLSNPSIYTDFNALAELRNRAKADKNQAVGEVAQQFEALMIQMMLKEMRNASPKSEFFVNKFVIYTSTFLRGFLLYVALLLERKNLLFFILSISSFTLMG